MCFFMYICTTPIAHSSSSYSDTFSVPLIISFCICHTARSTTACAEIHILDTICVFTLTDSSDSTQLIETPHPGIQWGWPLALLISSELLDNCVNALIIVSGILPTCAEPCRCNKALSESILLCLYKPGMKLRVDVEFNDFLSINETTVIGRGQYTQLASKPVLEDRALSDVSSDNDNWAGKNLPFLYHPTLWER